MNYLSKGKAVFFPLLILLTGQIVCGDGVAVAAGEARDIPMGQGAGGNVNLLPEDAGQFEDEDLFGVEGGYLHPYISIDFEYTDNLYNVNKGDTSNVLTKISPGLWFALPRKKIIPVEINPHNSSPGGLQLQFEDYEGTDRFEGYALGALDFKFYSDDSDLNDTDGVLEGLARYNMRGGLALQLVNRYTHGEDQFEFGSLTRDQFRRFDSNFFMATADWDLTEKFRVQLDYFNFYLSYDEEINQFLDRVDNGINLYTYFKYSLKTNFFLQYKYVDVAYDETIETDNNSNFFYGGIKWYSTDKLSFLAKIGYQKKEFDDNDLGEDDYDGLAFDFQAKYRYSVKTLFEFDIYRTNEETDTVLATDKTVVGAIFRYEQNINDRLSATFDLMYEDADYSSVPLLNIEHRDDTRFRLRPAVQYLFREWLMFELAYRYDTRNSSINLYDYDTNTFIVSANFAL